MFDCTLEIEPSKNGKLNTLVLHVKSAVHTHCILSMMHCSIFKSLIRYYKRLWIKIKLKILVVCVLK